ncbi:phage tail protein [Leptolyngbya cf. ectocarpi LEGE 11479]|uniref:Phage tail protein n=1 Tax=Leptolyngbya cf. ectocarpi LEGE 11479 TaxID=1828722 RepID=A0A928ZWN8_LEPEC|nr:phage tail protein [Leptolyngbya ectocarpi]MBE9068775.1 phage tail protein [Leptolyngbya cf. ectocarpi LEGE 11479]
MPNVDFPSELLLANRFYFELSLKFKGGNETVDAVFLECQKFQKDQKIIEIVEVAKAQWAKAKLGQLVTTKIPGRSTVENLVLKRGLTDSVALWQWFTDIESGKWDSDHVSAGSLNMFDQAGTVKAKFDFTGAWPTRYSTSDANAQSSEIAIEELELAVDGFTRSQ